MAELLIAMSLLALVSAVVFMLISALNRATASNTASLRQMAQAVEIRKEIDIWFSVIDSSCGEIEIGEGEILVVATAPAEMEFYIRWGEQGDILQFLYPSEEGAILVERDVSYLKNVSFLKREGELSDGSAFSTEESEHELTFPIRTHVFPAEFICKVVF